MKGLIKISDKISIRGVLVDNINMDEAACIIDSYAASHTFHAVFTPNAEIVELCVEDPAMKELVNSADLVVPDGAGVVLASKILGTPLKKKVAGVDLGRRAIALSEAHGYRVYFLGGKPGVAKLAEEKLREAYPDFVCVGMHDGYFQKSGEEADAVLDEVIDAHPDILFVCLGVPVQEKFIFEHKDKLKEIGLILALGGSLDSYAGTVKRAPELFIKLNLEWFYRLIKEPRRIGRMMKLPKFIFGTIFYKLTRKDKAQ